MKASHTLSLALILHVVGMASALAEDSSSEVDRIYGTRPRPRMQAPETARPSGEQKMTPEDSAKILGFQKERLQLPRDQATIGARIAANPVSPMLGGNSPDLFYVLYWNDVALDVVSIDHTNTAFADPAKKFFGEQFGPHRASRALAIVHLAMFEAINTITHEFASYTQAGQQSIQAQIDADINTNPDVATFRKVSLTTEAPQPSRVALQAAVSYAAYETLRQLYPQKAQFIDIANAKSLATISPQEPTARAMGELIGRSAAKIVLATRANDKSGMADPTASCGTPKNSLCLEPRFASLARLDPLTFQPDDVSRSLLRLGGNWGLVTPFEASNETLVHPKADGKTFVIDLGPGHKLEPPAPGTSSFNEALEGDTSGSIDDPHDKTKKIAANYGVWKYGGSGVAGNETPGQSLPTGPMEGPTFATPTLRVGKPNDVGTQAFQANFWGYDATSLLCAPPRLYNMIATVYPFDRKHPHLAEVNDATKMARYLALVNLALADAGVLSWKAKYGFNRDRPVDYIRFGLPTKTLQVGTKSSVGAKWTPSGQVSSNFAAPNTTPAFPSYPSGHAVFGGALFEVIRTVFHIEDATDQPFFFISDEYNGKNAGADGLPRPLVEVAFSSLKGAEWENGESRVWLGIHFQYDADHGIKLGNKIARNITDKQLKPIGP